MYKHTYRMQWDKVHSLTVACMGRILLIYLDPGGGEDASSAAASF